MIIIFLSSNKNKINQWCAITTFIYSIGTFKEYFYYELAPVLIEYGFIHEIDILRAIYSVMTAILYFYVMPSGLQFTLYFISFQKKQKTMFQLIRIFTFISPIFFSFVYKPHRLHFYQQTSSVFWYVFSIYNITYGIIITYIMIKSIYSANLPIQKRQNKLICIITIPPVWYWLITIFVIHSLHITKFFKIWKISAYILLISLIIFIIAAFSDGIMGLKIKIQMYDWNSEMSIINKGGNYITHALKNEITKIEWCVNNLIIMNTNTVPEELSIMERSVNHLKKFIYKTQLYSNEIILKKELVNVSNLINEAIASAKLTVGNDVYFAVNCPNNISVLCDPIHMLEVLNNLISNAVDAMNSFGTISISCKVDNLKHMLVIAVTDMGKGIPKKYINELFNPFFTTKNSSSHFGLGLSYCYNVLKQHDGYIDVQTIEGISSTFYLYLPTD
ncbi:MAG: ATP-binding region ATPase domain protein [Anaerocolumna sp.]|nr:ATP-binding region ATPase domain protein [Anaerocolumna sp.]